MPYKDRDTHLLKCKERYQRNRGDVMTRKEYLDGITKPLSEWTSNKKDKVTRARHLVHRAVRKNRIKKPSVCEECGGSVCAMNLHGHHHDYAKWWVVEWLCTFCHKKRHKKGW